LAQYQEIRTVAGTTLRIGGVGGSYLSFVETVTEGNLNGLITKGWELIKVITHCSVEHDMTAVAYVVGRPPGVDPDGDKAQGVEE
jgi:hypothetical protein